MKSDHLDLIKTWIGKSGDNAHPALWHMLDVAAVAREIQHHRPVHRDPAVCEAVTALIGLHDLGKVSAAFQNMIVNGQAQPNDARHWQITGYYFREFQARLCDWLGSDYYGLAPILIAVNCHHGSFQNAAPHFAADSLAIGSAARAAAGQIVDVFRTLFTEAHLSVSDADIDVLQWQVSGLVVQADWVGSNPEWFPATTADVSIDDYWARAQSKAARAVAQAGLFRASVAQGGAEAVIGAGAMRPMQRAAADITLTDRPSLYVIEDMTGSGKTEAALILAQRLLQHGAGRGVFFALPSMATSNAIYDRIQPMVGRLFDGAPQTALTHSRAGLNVTFQSARSEATDAETTCSNWLADGRRQVLFADFAVGTIDQALMSILPTRFNTLRQWALADKVLIIDEAHSYDPYMAAQLETLLRFHHYFGGSAILMTATLPSDMKRRFMAAYGGGEVVGAYPQITVGGQAVAVDPVSQNVRRVNVVRLGDVDAVLDQIVDAAGQGAAVAWVRNAVDDAIDAVNLLAARGIAAELLHARFTMGDRLDKEAALQLQFGKHGADRVGRVVVATQVIEQSLDLDFDVMISDLAPIGSLVQRAGRLWRHRDRSARPVDMPVLYVLSPDPDVVTGPRWLHDTLDRGAWVYDIPTQWRSARAVFDAGCLDEPAGLRALIDVVHSNAWDVPDVLAAAEQERLGQYVAERGNALSKVLVPSRGIDQMQILHDDETLTTRLGIPQTTLCLARRDGNDLVPWGKSWSLSEVSIATHRLRTFNWPTEADYAKIKREWTKSSQKYVHLVELEHPDLLGMLTYSKNFGLVCK